MRIHIKPICPEILVGFEAGWYEFSKGISAFEALNTALQASHILNPGVDILRKLVYMKNGKHISSDTILSDGDLLMVIRPVYGG